MITIEVLRKRRRLAYAASAVALLFAVGGGLTSSSAEEGKGSNGRGSQGETRGKKNKGKKRHRFNECTTSADCGEGQICRPNGKCYKDVGNHCGSDADCAPDEICRANGSCHQAPACTTDAECAADEICKNGKCHKDSPCQEDADCAIGQTCQDKRCTDNPPPPPPPPTPIAEICGDCIDNDGNGLTDFEDATCCAQAATMKLKRGKLVPGFAGTKIRLASQLARSGFTRVDPETHDLFLHIRPANGTDMLCANIPAGNFVRKNRLYVYKGSVASAQGVDRIAVKMRRNGRVKFAAKGKNAQVAGLHAGDLQVTVGFKSPAGDNQNRCSTTMSTFKPAGRGISAQ